MSEDRWTEVDEYLGNLFLPPDPVLAGALDASAKAGLPAISVSPLQGKLLYLLAKLQRARAILEIGTLGGYSAICLARALPPDGRLVTLEADPNHAEVALGNLTRAGLSGRVEIVLGPALESLPRLAGRAPFDLIFIDADKPGYPAYWEWSLRFSRQGTLIIADNVIREGAVVDEDSTDPNVRAVREYHALVAREPRVSALALQTVGCKGYDGLSLALVIE
ncbi:MAG TPA: O-methyltransferase [Gemmatimonadales bacterium]|nr:O-methyltransferase [Gemmatimonadales bacterium]